MDKAWKASERAIAHELGGVRTGNRGAAAPDVVVGEWLVCEVKSRRKLPDWLRLALAQVCGAAEGRRLGIVILHQLCDCHRDDLVLMRLSDFKAWFGGAGKSDA